MRLSRWIAVTAVGTLALALAGCGGSKDEPDRPAPSASSVPTLPSKGPAFPVKVGSVTLDKQPTKVISLSPTATEMLFAIGAGSQVAAVDDQSTFPAEAPRSNLSGFKPNAEAIAGRSPDLVVVSNDTDQIVSALTALKIPVYLAAAAKTLDDTYRQLTELGALTGRSVESADVVNRMRDDIGKLSKDLAPRTRKLTYYYELDPTFYTATSKTFVGTVLALFGLANIADPADTTGSGYPQLSAEAIVKANPDLIFLADSKCCQQSAATVAARPGWAQMTAVTGGGVVALDDDVASRWGPRVVDLVRAVSGAVAKAPVR